MRKIITLILIVVFLVCSFGSIVIAKSGPFGPAPNAGSGLSEGSGFDGRFGEGNGPGPAPSSGDGESEGPEW
jgi:hypothetical protein